MYFDVRVLAFNSDASIISKRYKLYLSSAFINIMYMRHALTKGTVTLSKTTNFRLFQTEGVCRR